MKVGFNIGAPQEKKYPMRYRFEFIMDYQRDKELIEHLEKQSNRGDYIRQLIAKDLKGTD